MPVKKMSTLYLDFPCVATKHIKSNGKRVFNATVCMEFQVCFTFAEYENGILSLCETTNVLIDAFVIPKSIFISKDHLN